MGDSVELHLYRASDYDLFPYGKTDSSVVTAELVTMKLLELNDLVFGHKKYALADRHLFLQNLSDYDFRTLESSMSQTAAMAVPCDYTCYYLQTNACISTTNWCTFCQLVTCFTNCPTTGTGGSGGGTPGGGFNWPPDPPISTGGSGGGGGSGSGNGSGTCRPNSSIIAEGRVPCGGDGPGPIVVLPPDETTFNPYIADTVIIDAALRNDFPCVARIIDSLTSYANINALAQVALHEVFGIN